MRTLGNIIWFIFGGALMGIGWYIAGTLAFISIIGIPWGRACFVIGTFTFAPFGKEVAYRDDVSGKNDIGTGVLGTIGNIIWALFFGIWLAIGHLLCAFGLFVTIVGIPFGLQHFKLAQISLMPIGKTVIVKR